MSPSVGCNWVNCVFTEAVEMDHAAQRATAVVLTSRLRLTPIGPADVDDLIVLYRDPLVAFWTGPWNPATVQTWATDMATRWTIEGVGKWLARSRSDAALVGRGGFTRFDLHGESVLELGWAVRDALTCRGYATEIGRAALDWAAIHERQTPIVAFTEVHNQASQAVMRHLGMRPAGMIRRTGLVEGRPGLHPDAPFALYRLEHDDRAA
jgi:RimJ/RimL family protein N-acetyltransferase